MSQYRPRSELFRFYRFYRNSKVVHSVMQRQINFRKMVNRETFLKFHSKWLFFLHDRVNCFHVKFHLRIVMIPFRTVHYWNSFVWSVRQLIRLQTNCIYIDPRIFFSTQSFCYTNNLKGGAPTNYNSVYIDLVWKKWVK